MIGTDVDTTTSHLEAMTARLADVRPGLAQVAVSLERHVARVFDSEGAELGRPWRRLAASTEQARGRRWGYYRAQPMGGAGPSAPILQWTGGMRLSFTEGSPFHVRRIGTDTLEFGSRLDRAVIHARGKRPILGFASPAQVEAVVVAPFFDWMTGRL